MVFCLLKCPEKKILRVAGIKCNKVKLFTESLNSSIPWLNSTLSGTEGVNNNRQLGDSIVCFLMKGVNNQFGRQKWVLTRP